MSGGSLALVMAVSIKADWQSAKARARLSGETMKPRARKAIGCVILLSYLAAYAAAAASLGIALAPTLPNWAELAYYAVAGLAWILPLKPLLAWTHRG